MGLIKQIFVDLFADPSLESVVTREKASRCFAFLIGPSRDPRIQKLGALTRSLQRGVNPRDGLRAR